MKSLSVWTLLKTLKIKLPRDPITLSEPVLKTLHILPQAPARPRLLLLYSQQLGKGDSLDLQNRWMSNEHSEFRHSEI